MIALRSSYDCLLKEKGETIHLIGHLDIYQHVQPNRLFILDEKHFFSSKEAYDIVSSLACRYDAFVLKENDKVILFAERSVDSIDFQ